MQIKSFYKAPCQTPNLKSVFDVSPLLSVLLVTESYCGEIVSQLLDGDRKLPMLIVSFMLVIVAYLMVITKLRNSDFMLQDGDF